VQTSNEQLDGLNARAQAFAGTGRRAGRAGGDTGWAAVYGLYAGDEIILRAASVHPELGALRNGTRGMVVHVSEDEHAIVRLSDGREATWERGQLDAASARLGYVTHTFPAQGQTVDRALVGGGDLWQGSASTNRG